MIYISPNGEYPRHYGDIMLDSPGWQLGDNLPQGWIQVIETPMPEISQDEIVFEAMPENIDGQMTQSWQVRPMTAEEKERRDAPANARKRLESLGFTDLEIEALVRGFVR